jgi:CDP-glycerol glycerophosphotransferase (TagB/SpsB family)
VTDYSSVWVDYLLLDRPLAFLVPDRDAYTRALVPADVLDWLPGQLVQDEGESFDEFLADIDARGAEGAVLRKEVATRIGLNPSRSSAEDLVAALADRGVLRLRR